MFLLRRIVLCGLVASAALVSACTVRPLYSDAPLSKGSDVGAAEELASIAIKPVDSRYAQLVRNNLIFALTGGGEPPTARYSLSLRVSEKVDSAARIQRTTSDDEPTAGTVRLTGSYVLTDAKTGKKITSGRRSISSSFDKPRQEFASYRAQIDAESRAARELADLLRLAIAQDLTRR